MTTTKIAYAAAATITCSMASKTTTQGRRSAAVDNSTNLYDDVLVHVSLKSGTAGTTPSFAVYAYASGDDGTTYETGGSTDADWNTLRGDEKLLGVVAAPSSTTVYTGVFSVARVYGGIMPRNWGIIIVQTAMGTLSATEGDHIKKYQGITYTSA